MSLTGGYEAAFELREEVVRDIFFEAWRSGAIPNEIRSDGAVAGYTTHTIVQKCENIRKKQGVKQRKLGE